MICPNCGIEIEKERDHWKKHNEVFGWYSESSEVLEYSCQRNRNYHHDTGHIDFDGRDAWSNFRCRNCHLHISPERIPEDADSHRECPYCKEWSGW